MDVEARITCLKSFNRSGRLLAAIAPNVPDDRPIRVEVGCSDEEPPSLARLPGDLIEHVLGDVFVEYPGKRRIACEGGAREHAEEAVLGIDVAILDCGEALLELIVVSRPKEREWRDQRSSTDTGDNVEPGHGPGLGPAGENSGPEGAAAATAGKCQRIELS